MLNTSSFKNQIPSTIEMLLSLPDTAAAMARFGM